VLSECGRRLGADMGMQMIVGQGMVDWFIDSWYWGRNGMAFYVEQEEASRE